MPQGFHAGLDPGDVGPGFLAQGLDAGLGRSDIGLGGEVGVEEGDVLFGESLGLFLGDCASLVPRRRCLAMRFCLYGGVGIPSHKTHLHGPYKSDRLGKLRNHQRQLSVYCLLSH